MCSGIANSAQACRKAISRLALMGRGRVFTPASIALRSRSVSSRLTPAGLLAFLEVLEPLSADIGYLHLLTTRLSQIFPWLGDNTTSQWLHTTGDRSFVGVLVYRCESCYRQPEKFRVDGFCRQALAAQSGHESNPRLVFRLSANARAVSGLFTIS
jgi:hypothetical protein